MTSELCPIKSLEYIEVDKWHGSLRMNLDEEVGSISIFKVLDCDILKAEDYGGVFGEMRELARFLENGHADWEPSLGRMMYIPKLLVKPEFRGIGLGLYLIDEACRKISDLDSLTVIYSGSLDDSGEPNKEGAEWLEVRRKLREYYG